MFRLFPTWAIQQVDLYSYRSLQPSTIYIHFICDNCPNPNKFIRMTLEILSIPEISWDIFDCWSFLTL